MRIIDEHLPRLTAPLDQTTMMMVRLPVELNDWCKARLRKNMVLRTGSEGPDPRKGAAGQACLEVGEGYAYARLAGWLLRLGRGDRRGPAGTGAGCLGGRPRAPQRATVELVGSGCGCYSIWRWAVGVLRPEPCSAVGRSVDLARTAGGGGIVVALALRQLQPAESQLSSATLASRARFCASGVHG